MDYKIVMPVLSDTMDKGKLVEWHVKEGQAVKKGDVIAEVESDKAIMEVQTFKDGVVKKLLVKEGEEVPVKKPIAIIEVGAKTQISNEPKPTEPKQTHPLQQEPKEIPKEPTTPPLPPVLEEILPPPSGEASPAAKKAAARLGIDIEKLQKEGKLPKPAHIKDVQTEALKRYFTPKALKLLEDYSIDPHDFTLDHKIDTDEVMEYVKEHNIPKIVPLTSNQKAVAKTVEEAAKKPVYFIYETFHMRKYEGIKLTSLILKIMGDVMQRHPLTRAVLGGDSYKIYPHSNISVAVAREDGLFMAVCKNIEEKSLQEIDEWVRSIKSKQLTLEDLSGSTFGISNLGMFGTRRFSAMINKNDAGIAAFGTLKESQVEVTFTLDHRVLNGVDGAKFVADLKEAFSKGLI